MLRRVCVRHPRDHGLVDVLGCDQVEDDRHQAGVLDPFVSAREVVDRDSRPEDLTDLKRRSGGWKRAYSSSILSAKRRVIAGPKMPGNSVCSRWQSALLKVLRSLAS